MATPAVMTMQCRCSFGNLPGIVLAGQPTTLAGNLPVANILHNKVTPFGLCSCPSNPQVAAATAAALGVLKPMPCIPMTVAPWMPGVPTVLVGGKPLLNDSSKLLCAYGGVISFAQPRVPKVAVP